MDRQPRPDLLALDDMTHNFDVVLRGYDRNQVHDVVDRLDGELRVALADKEASAARSAELASHLAGVQAEMESLRRKAQSAGEPNFESMGARISNMLRLAEEEATDIRRLAREDQARSRAELDSMAEETARIRAEAQDEARRTVEGTQDEARRTVEEAQDGAAKTIADAQKHADEVTARARRAVEAAEGESKAKVAKIEGDFDLAQKARRAEAARVEQERDQSSRRDAETRVAQAQRKAEEMISGAEQRVADLDSQRGKIHSQLTQIRELLASVPALDPAAGGRSTVAPGTSGSAAPKDGSTATSASTGTKPSASASTSTSTSTSASKAGSAPARPLPPAENAQDGPVPESGQAKADPAKPVTDQTRPVRAVPADWRRRPPVQTDPHTLGAPPPVDPPVPAKTRAQGAPRPVDPPPTREIPRQR